jgi:muramidase (phage lysozyme)
MARINPADLGHGGTNLCAFLDTIAYAEGTEKFGDPKDNGYRTLVGGGQMQSFADHPRTAVYLPKYDIHSTAAGRYQFLTRTWDPLARKLRLADMGPINQDKAALELVKEQGALQDVRNGRFSEAVKKVANIWASFPNAGYKQREVRVERLLERYLKCGGKLE